MSTWHKTFARACLTYFSGLVPKDPRSAVLHSVPDLEDSVIALVDALLRAEPDMRVTLLIDEEDAIAAARRRWDGQVHLLGKRRVRALFRFLRSKYVFTTHGLYGGVGPAPGHRIVNVWHGEAPGKCIGQYEGEPPKYASLATVASSLTRAVRAAEFGLPVHRVAITGAARNDRMLSVDRACVRTTLDIPTAPAWLWLPTYRVATSGAQRVDVAAHENGLPFSNEQVEQFDDLLEEAGLHVILKPHPLSSQSLCGIRFSNIRVITDAELRARDVTMYQLLGAADGLITDASSVWIDYALTNRPTVFAFPDLPEYRRSRGFSIEPFEQWFTGPVVADVAELVRLMREDAEPLWVDRRRELKRSLHAFDDANSADRILRAAGLTPGGPQALVGEGALNWHQS